MPVYTYTCGEGHSDDVVSTIEKRDTCPVCRYCGKPTQRDVVASMRPHTDRGYDTPIYSDAAGVMPSQVQEARQRFPHHEYTNDGRLVFRSHTQRERILKEIGLHDRR
jgi:hypothetical protein